MIRGYFILLPMGLGDKGVLKHDTQGRLGDKGILKYDTQGG
jgi:hypothetical protein